MAQKAKKDRAKSNTAALNSLHTGSLLFNILFLLSHLLWRPRSLVAYGLFVTPSLICEYVLEASGRPKYDPATGALRTAGEDLAAAGLTEYMFDVVWVTWAAGVLVVLVGNWGWLLWALVPAYGAYLGSGLLGMGRRTLAQMKGGDALASAGVGGSADAAQGNRKARRAA
ncbi:uncharacterized protein CPUR_04980 [Claviceps purpurea 20.1]|uniref:DUF788 domain protein n=1 Tax=Claviceps purpurea (strain 20.1) TaxID=1111077 RepID=M1WFQ6_CLAP2|nr:hypothetical protein E4U50_005925 [Claviceps purpurea]CCE31129.1 uncharacterized protein CPUR_04980 [Claviceps purpurea 20.1]